MQNDTREERLQMLILRKLLNDKRFFLLLHYQANLIIIIFYSSFHALRIIDGSKLFGGPEKIDGGVCLISLLFFVGIIWKEKLSSTAWNNLVLLVVSPTKELWC